MATEKKAKPNIDLLFKKVDDLGKRLEEVEINVSESIESLNMLVDGFEENDGLSARIKSRLGL